MSIPEGGPDFSGSPTDSHCPVPESAAVRQFPWTSGELLPEPLLEAARHARASKITPLILVDGLSGSGKSTLACALASALSNLEEQNWRVLGPDLWFPGWDGLRAAQEVTCALAENLRAGRPGAYRPWDWERSRPLSLVEVSAGVPTILEGCGVLTSHMRRLADYAIWVEAEGGGTIRKERALARDGDAYRPWWGRWEEQDLARLESDRSRSFADAIIYT